MTAHTVQKRTSRQHCIMYYWQSHLGKLQMYEIWLTSSLREESGVDSEQMDSPKMRWKTFLSTVSGSPGATLSTLLFGCLVLGCLMFLGVSFTRHPHLVLLLPSSKSTAQKPKDICSGVKPRFLTLGLRRALFGLASPACSLLWISGALVPDTPGCAIFLSQSLL